MNIPRLRGEVTPPGDKSISHRALILGALALGPSRVRGLNPGADVLSTRRALGSLGIAIAGSGEALTVEGSGGRFRPPSASIDCGNSGTTMRLLCGLLAGQPFPATLVGDASLSARPMERVADPLRRMGARVETHEGHAPVTVHGGALRAITFESPVPSAQVKSAVLLAGLFAEGRTAVRETIPSRDHTERMLASMGAAIERRGGEVLLQRGTALRPLDLEIPGDPSAAAFYAAAAVLIPGSRIRIRNVGVNPTRAGFLHALARMGASIHREAEREASAEPVCDLQVAASSLDGIEIGASEIPSLVDEVPILAVLAACARTPSRIEGASELRVKETDRLRAMAEGLQTLGADVTETPEGLRIAGGWTPRGGRVDARGDHRVAMSFRVLSLVSPDPVEIVGYDSIVVSDPAFEQSLNALAGREG